MSLDVTRLDSLEATNKNQWNNVVEQSALGCVFHRYEWLRAVEVGLEADARHLVVSKKGNPVGILPFFVTDLGPASRLSSIRPGYGGPVVMSEEADVMELLLEAVPECCDRSTLLTEFRTYDPGFIRYRELFEQHGYTLTIKECRFALDLSRGWEALFSDMDSERRRGIRRGHDLEFEIVDEELSTELLRSFYRDYATVMDRVTDDILPRSFMLELPRLEDRLKLFSLRVDGERQGMYLYILDEEQSALQHLFTAVTEDHFEYHAAELLHEHAIKWGIEQGYETYELRGSVPDFRDGVFRFKENFGAEAFPLLVVERGNPQPVGPMLTVGRSLSRQFRS